MEEMKTRVREIIEPVVSHMGVEFVDLELNRMKGKGLLRVFIEKDEGVTIDDCVDVSREISAVMDVEDPIPFSYVLEVSSPGLDRPLKDEKDFKRYSGRTIRVVVREPIGKQNTLIGKLVSAGDRKITLQLPGNEEVLIGYENISRARLEVEV